MQASLEILRANAHRAYERGRLRYGFRALYFVLPLVVLSAATCASPAFAVGVGIVWAGASIYFLWQGQVAAKAAWQGLMWGAGIGLVPIVAELTGKCCSLGSHEALCAGIGLVAGAAALHRSGRFQGDRATHLAVMGTVIALASALGCAALGLGAVPALLIGVLVPTVPGYVSLRRLAL